MKKTSPTALAICILSAVPALRAQTTLCVTAGANDASRAPSISDDGRFIAFESLASNLVAADTNGVADVFVHDRQTLTTTRASLAPGGAQANGSSSDPSISADGNVIAFVSYADNLVANDTNAAGDVFVYDRSSGITTRVSVASSGAQADGESSEPALSGNGRFVAFTSLASNLIVADGNLLSDVFVRDLQTNTTTRVSEDPNGSSLDNASGGPSISANGRYVAFDSLAGHVVVGDFNFCSDVFVFDRQTSLATRISVSPSGGVTYQPSYAPSISDDGRYVAFHSLAPNITHDDNNGNTVDVFVRDRQTAMTTLASVGVGGVQGSSTCRAADVSNDGRYVVFESAAPELVANDTNAAKDVFVRDVVAGTLARASRDSHGGQGDAESTAAAISGDSRYIAFRSSASTLVAGDTNGVADVFVHDRLGVAPTSETYCTPSTSSNGCNATIAASGAPSISQSAGFTLTCTGVEGQRTGLFFYGASGSTALPWAVGSTSVLCVQPPTQRTTVLSSGGSVMQCNGSLSIDVLAFLAANPAALGQPLSVGERFDAQAWFRDPPAPKTTNLSDAVRFWMTP